MTTKFLWLLCMWEKTFKSSLHRLYVDAKIAQYRDAGFPSDRLLMLGAKTTCKDRWRQVLAEADKINPKHLLTLEAGISPVQTDEMQRSGLALVIPTPIQESYKPAQLGMISSFGEFIGLALTSKSPAT